jgi:hypothetical protein
MLSTLAHNECLLAEIEQMAPWLSCGAVLLTGNSHPPYQLEATMRIHLLQNWYRGSAEVFQMVFHSIF